MDVLNRQTTLMDKYYIDDILTTTDNQNIYTALIADTEQSVIINQVPISSPWQADPKTLKTLGIIDVFCNKDCYYIVAPAHQGKPLKEYILNNDLFLKFKLEVLIDILHLYNNIPKDTPLEVKLNLIDINRIVIDNTSVKIDYSAMTTHNNQATSYHLVKKLVSIIYFIFSSSQYQEDASLEKLPSDITKIINSLLSERISSVDFDKILKDIEATTLFKLFYKQTIGEHNETKEKPHGFVNLFQKPKSSFMESKLVKSLLLGFIALVLLGGGYKMVRSMFFNTTPDPSAVVDNPSDNDNTSPDSKTNIQPIASFYTNQNQVKQGDTVSFFSQSYDDDDSIESHLWIVTKDAEPIETSYQDWFFEYTFTSPGDYQVILRVTDAQSESSEDFVLDIKVEEDSTVDSGSSNGQDSIKNQDWKGINKSNLTFDDSYYYTGSTSLKVVSDSQNTEYGAMVLVDLNEDKYELFKGFNTLISIFIRAEQSDTKAHLVITAKDISGNTINSITTNAVTLSSEWSKISTTFKIDSNCHNVEVSVITQQGTIIWLDNFEIDLMK